MNDEWNASWYNPSTPVSASTPNFVNAAKNYFNRTPTTTYTQPSFGTQYFTPPDAIGSADYTQWMDMQASAAKQNPFIMNQLKDTRSADYMSGNTGNSFGGKIPSGANQPSWLSRNMGNISKGIEAGAAVGQVVLGFENLEEQKKVNAMNMALAKKDLANRAQVINNALGNQTNSQAAGDERFAVSSTANPDAIAARRAEARAYAENKLNEQKVSGTV